MNCPDCPLKEQVRGVPPYGTPGGIAIVGEAPGIHEEREGRPFVGISGRLLRTTLHQIGIDPDTIWFTNTCLCRPVDGGAPTPSMIESCRDRLFTELREQNIHTIIALGGTAMQSLLTSPLPVTKARGRFFYISDKTLGYDDELAERTSRPILVTWHPAAVLRDPDKFQDFADDLMLAKSPPAPSGDLQSRRVDYTVCDSILSVRRMVKQIYALPSTHLICDLETTGLSEIKDRILVIGIAASPDHIWIIPDSLMKDGLVRDSLKQILEDPRLFWAGHNINQFDCKFLRRAYGINVRVSMDTMLAHYVVDERQGGHDLKTLARKYCNAHSYADKIKASKYDPTKISIDELQEYLAWDLYYNWLLVPELQKELRDAEASDLYKLLLDASAVLGIVEETGCRIDAEYLKGVGEQLETELSELLVTLRQQTDRITFNPNSPQQVAPIIKQLGFKVPNTERENLEGIDHPIVKNILEYRQKSKLRSTYVDGILSRLDQDSRVHADFNLWGTRTGRLSSSSPNLQNIPILIGPIIRNAFVPTPDWVLLSADYSQLELRVAAWYSRDEYLLDIYRTGQDLHKIVAAECFQVRLQDVTFDQRYAAKYIDFGILYGRGAVDLANGELKCDPKTAQRYIDRFLGRFSGLTTWMEDQRRYVIEMGETCRTPFGRVRRFPLILDENRYEIERRGINTPIQGTATDICLTALTRLGQRFDWTKQRVLSTVHDSILFEVRRDCLDDSSEMIRYEMEENILPELREVLPFTIKLAPGDRWGDISA